MREGILELSRKHYVIFDRANDEVLGILQAGDVIDVYIGGVWIRVRVEHSVSGYYLTTDEESFRPFMGMKARI